MVIAESLRYFPIFTGGDVIESRLINLGSAEAISRDGGKRSWCQTLAGCRRYPHRGNSIIGDIRSE